MGTDAATMAAAWLARGLVLSLRAFLGSPSGCDRDALKPTTLRQTIVDAGSARQREGTPPKRAPPASLAGCLERTSTARTTTLHSDEVRGRPRPRMVKVREVRVSTGRRDPRIGVNRSAAAVRILEFASVRRGKRRGHSLSARIWPSFHRRSCQR